MREISESYLTGIRDSEHRGKGNSMNMKSEDFNPIYFEIADAIDLLDNVTADGPEDANRLGLAEMCLVRAREALLAYLCKDGRDA